MKKKIMLSCLGAVLLALAVVFFMRPQIDEKGVKIEKISNVSDLIFRDGELVPNTDFSWGMSTEDFLAKVYRADMLRPDSETFDFYRYHYIEEKDITTYTPPIEYKVSGIPGEMDVAYVFNRDGLYRAGYSWGFPAADEQKVEKAQTVVKTVVEELNSNPKLTPEPFDLAELLEQLEDSTPAVTKHRWIYTDNPDLRIELMCSNIIRDSRIIGITVDRWLNGVDPFFGTPEGE